MRHHLKATPISTALLEGGAPLCLLSWARRGAERCCFAFLGFQRESRHAPCSAKLGREQARHSRRRHDHREVIRASAYHPKPCSTKKAVQAPKDWIKSTNE